MNAQELLRVAIGEQEGRLRSSVPADRSGAVVAVLRAQERLRSVEQHEQRTLPDLIAGRRLSLPGGNRALQFCLEATVDVTQNTAMSESALGGWGERFLQDCGQLVEAEMVLAHGESGFMRLASGGGVIDAWIATKRTPASWRERADFDWWAGWLSARQPVESGGDAQYQRRAEAYLARMAYQTGFPPDAVIGGCSVQMYRRVLIRLIAGALQAHEQGERLAHQSERALIGELATALRIDVGVVARAVAGFTLDEESASYHAAVPGIASAPLVRAGPDRIVWSLHGLTTEPLLFLIRELRRREAQELNNTAFLREDVFRQDLYALFQDKRFVTSSGRIELRRNSGTVRTDIDAVVFDRKSGTLGLFELKSQDPFGRSAAEITRQRENVLYANRQVSGVLAWVQQHGANEVLQRVDARIAKTFRAQKVYPFVLGRYIAHFHEGPEPDKRAAWGTWLQVLRLLDGQPVRASDSNPLASLFNRLTKDAPLVRMPVDASTRVIEVGSTRLVVHRSHAAYQAGGDGEGR